MRDNQENPFKFGAPVEDKYYLPLPLLTRSIEQFLENRIHIVLVGPRRFGKTSFVLDLLRQTEARGRTCLFIDIFNITSHRDFLQQILRALRGKQTWSKKFMEWVESIPRLRPRINMDIDQTGAASYALSATFADKDVKDTIQDVLAGLQKIGDNVVVAFDEFQKIAELDDSGWLEATLRTEMQKLPNTVFLFTGSRKSLISDMMNNTARPFYRSCQQIDFPAFGDEFIDWIEKRFKSIGVGCDRDALMSLRKQVQNTPNYIQMACFHLVAAGRRHVGPEEVKSVLHTIVRQNDYAYQTLLNTLTPIQQRALRLAAKEETQVFSQDLLERYEIPSGAALASAIKALKGKQILDEDTRRGKVIFDDPLFAIWLRTEFAD